MEERKIIANEMSRVEVTENKCEKHDESMLKHPFSKNLFCPICTKERMERDALELERINSKDATNYNNFFRYSSKYKGKTNEFIRTPVIDFLDGYTESITEGYGNVIISGNAGVGKSFATYWFAKKMNKKFYDEDIAKSVLYISTTSLINEIKSTFNNPNTTESEYSILKRIIDADVLVLDDLGKESSLGSSVNEGSNFIQRILFEIFDKRDRTIISTNFSSVELKTMYDSALYDRILSGAKGNIFAFGKDAESMRL